MKNQRKISAKFYLLFGLVLMCFSILMCNVGTRSRQAQDTTKNQLDMAALLRSGNIQEWQRKAEKMVRRQIVARGIKDKKVIEVMKRTPRHLFVPEDMVKYAYDDGPLPIGADQTISQPFIVALMTELLHLKGSEKVLEIGTGSGYQAAVLSQLVDSCYSIELIKILADSAGERLRRLGYENVVVKCGDGYIGWPQHAPFDCIIVTAAAPEIPQNLVAQLKPGGRMVLPVGQYYQELILLTKKENEVTRERIIPVRFVPMVKPGER